MDKLRESDLYAPVRDYLEGLGYEVRGEVRGCDIAAVRDGELIVVELKTGFTLELIYQALDRQRIADGVYVAVPLPKRGYMAPQIKDMQSLCRRLELGLIFVGFTSKGAPQLDVYLHPKEAGRPRTNRKRRLAVLREHGGRTGSANTGGVTRKKILTAYKERSLLAARILRSCGPLPAEDVKKLGGPADASALMGRNPMGWFQRTAGPDGRKYLYSVSEKGMEALEEYGDLLA